MGSERSRPVTGVSTRVVCKVKRYGREHGAVAACMLHESLEGNEGDRRWTLRDGFSNSIWRASCWGWRKFGYHFRHQRRECTGSLQKSRVHARAWGVEHALGACEEGRAENDVDSARSPSAMAHPSRQVQRLTRTSEKSNQRINVIM